MKKCPFCAEEIQDDAIKCRFCGEFLDKSFLPKAKTKWYQSTYTIIIALLCVGPFALPLVWFHPQYKSSVKIIVTVAVITLTLLLVWLSNLMISRLMSQMESLGIQ